jgi:hypothetical protein
MSKQNASAMICAAASLAMAGWARPGTAQEAALQLWPEQPAAAEPELLPGLDVPMVGPLVMPESEWWPPALCFDAANPPSADQMTALYRAMRGAGTRYNAGSSWASSPNTPVNLTWSFVPDGTVVPASGSFIPEERTSPSTLFATMDNKFGGDRSAWIAYIQGCFDRWSQLTGVRYTRVRYQGHDWDDGASFPDSDGSPNVRGQIRIAMHVIDGSGRVLAYNRFPSNGDMVLDASEAWENNANAFVFLRNVVSHEHGHGLGLSHVCPTMATKLMEPFYSGGYDGPQHDDTRGAQSLYGDAFEPNNDSFSATTLNYLNPISLETTYTIGADPRGSPQPSVWLTSLTAGDEDWFHASVQVGVPVSVTVTPQGYVYDSSTQRPDPPSGDSGCNSGHYINSLNVARVSVRLVASDRTTVLATATATALSRPASISDVTVPAGGFYVVVSTPDAPTDVQSYTLAIGTGSASPLNDNCAAALSATFGTTYGSNFGAHRDGVGYCDPVGTIGGDDVWYRFSSPCSGPVRVDTCGSSIGTLLSIFPGNVGCPPPLSAQIAASCYASGGNPCSPQSSLTFSASAGSDYLIRVAGDQIPGTSPPQYEQGAFTLRVTTPSITNNTCAAAPLIADNQTVAGSTCGAAASGTPAACAPTIASPDVWYRYVPSCSGRVGIDLCGSNFDTVAGLYSGTCDALVEEGCNDDAPTHCTSAIASYLESDVAAGQAYFVRVTGYNGAFGQYVLRVAPVAPSNASCATATAIHINDEIVGNTCGAPASGHAACGSSDSSPAVWYSFIPECTGTVQLDTCGSDFDTVLSVQIGACSIPALLGCNDDAGIFGPCAGTRSSYLTVPVNAGAVYQIRVSGYAGAAGRFRLHAYFQPNDNCANATPIGSGSFPFSTVCARADGSASCGSSNSGPSVWFSYTAPCNGFLAADTCGSSFPGVLSVYSGGCGNPTQLACNTGTAGQGPCPTGNQAFLTTPCQAGATYLIRVAGRNGGGGTGTLHVSCHAPCPVDFNLDLTVNVQDYLAFLAAYSRADSRADMDGNGMINVQDYLTFLRLYAAGCQ